MKLTLKIVQNCIQNNVSKRQAKSFSPKRTFQRLKGYFSIYVSVQIIIHKQDKWMVSNQWEFSGDDAWQWTVKLLYEHRQTHEMKRKEKRFSTVPYGSNNENHLSFIGFKTTEWLLFGVACRFSFECVCDSVRCSFFFVWMFCCNQDKQRLQ